MLLMTKIRVMFVKHIKTEKLIKNLSMIYIFIFFFRPLNFKSFPVIQKLTLTQKL